MTDYLSLARERAAPALPENSDNPYLALASEQRQLQQNHARTVLESAFKDNPEVAAERQRLTRTTGLPLSVVERNLEELRVKEQARAIDLVSMAQDSPVLYRQLIDPTFTTVAVDDIPTLQKIERGLGSAARYVMGADGKGGLPADAVGAGKTLALGATVGVGKTIFDMAAVVSDLVGADNWAAGYRGMANRAQGAMDEFGMQAESSTGQAIKSGLQSAGQNLALLPLGLQRQLFATSERAASVVAGLMGAGVGADAFNEARDKGMTKTQATVYGVPQGAFEYVFEKIPAAKLFSDIAANTGLLRTIARQTMPEVATEQLTTLAQDFTTWMNMNPEKTIGEFLAERPEAAYQTLVATLVGVGVQTSAIHGMNKVVEKYTDTKLQFEQDAFNDLLKAAGSSALRERSPEQFRAHVQAVIDNSEDAKKEVYVDAEVLNQLPPELLAQLPGVAEQMEAALAANSTVTIPMADVLTVAPGTPLEQVLNDHARMSPEAMSKADAQQAGEAADRFKQEADRVIQQAADQQAMQASSDRVKQGVLDQLNSVGRFRQDVNEAYATWTAAFFTTMAGRYGMTPEQMAAKYPLRIVGQGGAGGTLMGQGFAAEGKTDFREGKAQAAQTFAEFGGYTYDGSTLTRDGQRVADLKLRIDGNRLVIDDIETVRKGQGDGTAALQAVIAHAHQNGLTPALFTDAMRGKAQQKRLRDYYPRLGFVANKGENKIKGMKEEFYFPTAKQAAGQLNQPAYHGTPHRGIEKFSTDKIGTGEGAQAYGWGLYFASQKDIAEWYRNNLSDASVDVNDLKPAPKGSTADNLIRLFSKNRVLDANDLRAAGIDPDNVNLDDSGEIAVGRFIEEGFAAQDSKDLGDGKYLFTFEDGSSFLDDDGDIKAVAPVRGQLYEVDIPEDDTMLLWDKPLSEQPEAVRNAVLEAAPQLQADVDKRNAEREALNAANPGRLTHPVVGKVANKVATVDGVKGQAAYESISKALGSDKAASKALAALGIKGIKYLDGTSRSAGDGSYNYVVFSGDDVAIKNQFYQNPQSPRGTFNPESLELALNSNADLSTFLHETGHFFLEVMGDLATQPDAPADIKADMDALLKWFGITGDETVGGPDAGGELAQSGDNFAKWFGDSKVVDAEGKPLVVYHGTNAHAYSPGESIEVFNTRPTSGRGGAFFTDSQQLAGQYGERTYATYLSMQNPLVVYADGKGWTTISGKSRVGGNITDTARQESERDAKKLTDVFAELAELFDEPSDTVTAKAKLPADAADLEGKTLGDLPGLDGESLETDAVVKAARRLGYDGVIFKNVQDSPTADAGYERVLSDVFAVFNPTQIKSATDNNGQYDPNDPSILRQGGPATKAAPIQPKRTPLETWNAMTLEQKRPYHERFAESIEQYLMEGNAPSLELQPLFRKFRAWMLNVYKSVKQFLAGRSIGQGAGGELAQAPVESDAFKRWFGDSKVVDAKGKPLVVYHGSPQGGFDEFDVSNVGVFFSSRYDIAASYAGRYSDVELPEPDAEFYDDSQGVYSTYLKIENPLVVDWGGKDWGAGPEGLKLDEWANRAKRAGHDGLIVENVVDTGWVAPGLVEDKGDGTVYVAFNPTQIKSATDNNGQYDPNDPSILRQGGPVDPSNIQLSDEVRRVFDRMLASEEQIKQAEQTAGLLPEFDATNEALEKLTARSLRDLKWAVNARAKFIKDLQKQAKEARKVVEAEVTAEVNAMSEFAAKAALDQIRKDTKAKPTDADMATVADSFGYESAEKMLQAIDAIGKKADVIEGMTDQRMLERHGDLIDQRAIEQAANEAVHNEARARALATELRSQAEALNPRQDTGQTNAAGSKITVNALVEASKQFAANVIARTPLRDLKSRAREHIAAERRAGQRWQEATTAGNSADAIKAKQDQLLNNAAAKAAMEAQTELRKMLEFFKRVVKDGNEKTVEKGRDPDVVNAARAVLGAYGIAPKSAKSAAEYMDLVAKNDPAMFAALQPAVQGALANAQPLDALTMEQVRGLYEEVQAMWHLAKRSRQMEVDGNLLDIQDAADELQARMQEIGVPDEVPGESSAMTPKEELARKLQHAGSLLRRTEQWAQGMGNEFTRLVFQPVKDAADRYRADRVKFRKAYQALVDNVAPKLQKGLIEAPELGYTFGKGHNGIGHAELLHAILHTGNESNKRKLLLGRKWATENADGTLDTSRWDAFINRMHQQGVLSKEHYDFAQGVWDLLEQTKPLAQKTHRDVFGRYFAEVTADAFDTPFGQYRGGYVPAQADPRIVQDAQLRELIELENEGMAFSFPGTNKGFTKSRTEYNRPLMLDLRTIGQHIDKVLLFSHMEPAVRDVNKLLSQKGVSYSLGRIDPTIYAGMLTPWLKRSARQIVETPMVGDGSISRVLSAARNRAGMSLMFANISNTIQQITGFSTAAIKVKPASMTRAAAQFIASPKQTAKAVADASPFMANRMDNEIAAINDAMNEILLDPNLYEKSQAWFQKHAYFMQTAMANTMEPIIWTAAYNDALAEGQSEKDAVRHADSVIRTTQGSTLPEDVSRFETGSPWARMFTQFVGYFNMLANTNATALKQVQQEMGFKKGAGKALGIVTLGLLVPIWIAEAIAQAFRGGPDDEDKDGYLDDWLAAVFGMGTIKGTLAMVPVVAQVAQLTINKFNSNPADDKFSLSPAVSILESAASVPVDVYKAITDPDKLNKRNAVRDVASLISLATGIPATAFARPLGYLAGVADDKIDPTGPVDLARGLATGTPSPQSK